MESTSLNSETNLYHRRAASYDDTRGIRNVSSHALARCRAIISGIFLESQNRALISSRGGNYRRSRAFRYFFFQRCSGVFSTSGLCPSTRHEGARKQCVLKKLSHYSRHSHFPLVPVESIERKNRAIVNASELFLSRG